MKELIIIELKDTQLIILNCSFSNIKTKSFFLFLMAAPKFSHLIFFYKLKKMIVFKSISFKIVETKFLNISFDPRMWKD